MDIKNGKKIRDRNWFLTINPSADCYNNIDNILKNLKLNHYAYICHTEADEDNENINHYHLCIEFVNARSFEAVQKLFNGAHIEHMKYKFQCYKYLIHKDCDNKKKYDVSCIVTDSLDYYNLCIASDEFEKLTTQTIFEDLQHFQSMTDFVKKYGLCQVKTYHNIIRSLLNESSYCKQIDELQIRLGDFNATIDELKLIISEKDDEIKRLNKILDDRLPF